MIRGTLRMRLFPFQWSFGPRKSVEHHEATLSAKLFLGRARRVRGKQFGIFRRRSLSRSASIALFVSEANRIVSCTTVKI